MTAPVDGPLAEPPELTVVLPFGAGPLDALREFVAGHAMAAGLTPAQTANVVLAVNEVGTNSLRHGGGGGTLRLWHEGDRLVCEIRDDGHLSDPLVGRRHPRTEGNGGRGLWLVNQLCDLLQLRTSAAGTVARLHMWRS